MFITCTFYAPLLCFLFSVNLLNCDRRRPDMLIVLKKGVPLALFVIGTCMSTAQNVSVRFRGNISDNDADLPGAMVQVSEGGKVFSTVMTDVRGDYAFEVPLNGDFLITVSKEG